MGEVTPRLLLAVDGGNSKTDVVLIDTTGRLLSWVRGPGCSHSPRRTAALMKWLATAAADAASLPHAALAQAHGAYYLAGVDLPTQAQVVQEALAEERMVGSLQVDNDAWALLRTGGPVGPAVAVVCGAGLKCVARAGDALVEFPSLGWQTGDLEGAGDFLAREAVRAAVRAEDGRGPQTALHRAVCEHFEVSSTSAMVAKAPGGRLAERTLDDLAPEVLRCADAGDPMASSIVRTLATEVATLARASRARLRAPVSAPWSLVLGGGLFADPAGRLLAAVRAVAPDLECEFSLTAVTAPPVVGAVLLGMERVGLTAVEEPVRQSIQGASPTLLVSAAWRWF